MPKQSTDFEQKLKQTNEHFKHAELGVAIRRRGNRLYLRAMLPPKPGSDKSQNYQQEIKTGYKAVPQGLASAKKDAKDLAGELAGKTFDWANYGIVVKSAAEKTVAEWLAEMEIDFFNHKPRNATTEVGWKTTYRTFLKRMPQEAILTQDLLKTTIVTKSEPDTCTRRGMAYACAKLGIFAGLEGAEDLKQLKGKYSSLKPAPRKLPSDQQIVDTIHAIPDPEWRWAIAIIATYGLRPHEVFHLEPLHLLRLGIDKKTKTGVRVIPPIMPEWIDEFDLVNFQLPKVKAAYNGIYGAKVCYAFKKFGIPFKPYNLRHAWAVRALKHNIPPAVAAKWMGHSLVVHNKVYQAWIDEATETEIYAKAIPSAQKYLDAVARKTSLEDLSAVTAHSNDPGEEVEAVEKDQASDPAMVA